MSEWKKVRLGDVAELCLGKMLDAKKNKGTLRPYLNNVAVRWGCFDLVDLPEMRIEDAEVERYKIKKGDIVICEGGEPGRCAVWRSEEPIFFQKALHRARVKPCFDSNFIYYQLCHLVKSGETRNFETGSTIRHLPAQELKQIPISLPPLPTQRKIAAVLGALDDKIENNRKICANLEAQAQAIFKSWFVDFEPFGGKMPSGWKMGKLGDVAFYRQSKITADELTAETYYSTENMLANKQGLIPATSLPQNGEVPACEKGDVLISNIRPYFKKICFSWSQGGHSPDVLCLSAKNASMRYWLYRQLWDDAFFAYVMSSAKGTKMPRGDKEQILAYAMAIPNENDVARFNALIEPMCESIVSKGIESRVLAATRDALLPKLMSGEIDVEKVNIPA